MDVALSRSTCPCPALGFQCAITLGHNLENEQRLCRLWHLAVRGVYSHCLCRVESHFLAGYDTSGGEDAELLLGFAAFVTFVTVLFLSVWLFVRFLRRGRTANAFTDPPAFVQRWVANAQSRWGAILRKGVVYIGYVVSLSVAFAAIISVLAVAKEIITILAGQAPEFEGWTVVDRIGLAALTISIIGLATLLFLARNTSRGELRRRLWRSFTWSLIITACNSGMSAALVICHSYDLLNKPSPWTKALFGEMFELLAQSPALFAADVLAGFAVTSVMLTPYAYGVVWLGDNAQAKGRYSISGSMIIALAVVQGSVGWLAVLGGVLGFVIAGPDGRGDGGLVGALAGVLIGIALTRWIVVRAWPRSKASTLLAEPVREITSIPEDIADAVRDSAARPL